MAKKWKQYQDEVADFFRSLGLSTDVEQKVEGVRATHEIDVWVTFEQYGVDIKWVVECKLWNSPIPKEKVLALQQVLQDVGADRGVLLSESGFQAGAVRAAERTNVTLTNLEELQEHSHEEKAQFELSKISKRFALLDSRLRPLVYDSEGYPFPYHPSIPRESVVSSMGDLFSIRIMLPKVYAREFPISISLGEERAKRTVDIDEFIRIVSPALDRIQGDIEDLLDKADECHQEAIKLGLSLIDAVESLLEDAESALFEVDIQSDEFERSRLKALEGMKEVGYINGELKSLTDSRMLKDTRELMRLLIDTVYLHLTESSLEKTTWDDTRKAVIEKLGVFREAVEASPDQRQV